MIGVTFINRIIFTFLSAGIGVAIGSKFDSQRISTFILLIGGLLALIIFKD